MSYTDDAVKAKLSALSETQENIVTVAQWVMFHRRYADRTAQLWLQRLKDSTPAKRLNLIYLANEVVQQSKARKKDDFVTAFSPIIPDATASTAKGATNEVIQKLRRVVEVWRQRQIFDQAVQEAVEARLDEVDKSQSRGPAKKPLLGGSLFSDSNSATPAELQPLVTLQQFVSKASLASQPLVTKANVEFAALNDGSQPIPTPPVHAARLSALIKSLANAEDAVAESFKMRKALIAGLEELLATNHAQLTAVEVQHAELSKRKESMTQKRHEVEDQIMRGLSSVETSAKVEPHEKSDTPSIDAALGSDSEDIERPEMERFTPPLESTTPTDPPPQLANTDDTDTYAHARPHHEDLTPPPIFTPAPPIAVLLNPVPPIMAVLDPRRRPHPSTSSPPNGLNNLKRRKLSEMDDELNDGADAMAGLDADVVGMLG